MSIRSGLYLGITEIQDFVQQLVDQDKVVLDVLLGNFAEVISHDFDDLVEELEYEGGVDILLGHGRDPNVDALHVKEARARDVRHRGTNLLTRVNDVNAKGCQLTGREKENQSPKGNMWSAIPVALLRMLVIVGDG